MADERPRATIAYAHGALRAEALVFASLDSTNTRLRALEASGAPEGAVVVADEQTAGRGRHGRSWRSPAGAGLYASILLRPGLQARAAPTLTFLAAVAVAEALERIGVREVALKWPNDVLARGRKICGILTETSIAETRVEWAIVGIGVNLRPEAVPPELASRATSLEREGVRATNLELLDPILAAIARGYAALLSGGHAAILERWQALAPMARGASVVVDDGAEVYRATTCGLAPDGLLRVRRADGATRELSAADVTLSKGIHTDEPDGVYPVHPREES